MQGRSVNMNGLLKKTQADLTDNQFTNEPDLVDSIFRKAFTRHADLSMGFEWLSGERLISDLDVVPVWIPKTINLRNLVYVLFAQTVHPEEQQKLESLFEMNYDHLSTMTGKPFWFDCKLCDLSRQTHMFYWYRIYHSFTEKDSNQSMFFYITIINVQQQKLKEQSKEHNLTLDPVTGLLNRSAFDNQVIAWAENLRREEREHSICLVIIMIENVCEINTHYGRAYLLDQIARLGKTVKAMTHPNELCCRFGLGEFALALAGTEEETLNERVKLLQMACNARNADLPGVKVLMEYQIESTNHTDQTDLILEQTHRALLLHAHQLDVEERHNRRAKTMPDKESETDESVNRAVRETGTCSNERIVIRTFGHFDVFVDGEAVLFNHPKAKEYLAILVDRRGGFVSAGEAISCLWEDEPSNNTTLARCRKAAMHMKQSLAKYGIEWIVETISGKRRILIGRCNCDLEQYLRKDREPSRKTIGTYMSEYSWAENSLAID